MAQHQRQDETKQPPPPPSTETTNTPTTAFDMYLSTHLIVPYFITAGGEIKRPEHLIAWWSRIFSFLYVPDDKDHIPLRSLCRLFRDALKPPPLWTTFPHPNYSTLNGLMDKLNEMYAALSDLIVWEECTAPALVVGTKVNAKFVDRRGGISFKDATIQKVNEDDTFDVAFDDVYSQPRKNVPLNEIQIPNVSANDLL